MLRGTRQFYVGSGRCNKCGVKLQYVLCIRTLTVAAAVLARGLSLGQEQEQGQEQGPDQGQAQGQVRGQVVFLYSWQSDPWRRKMWQ